MHNYKIVISLILITQCLHCKNIQSQYFLQDCIDQDRNRTFFYTLERSGTHWTMYILGMLTHRPISAITLKEEHINSFIYNPFDLKYDYEKSFIHHTHFIWVHTHPHFPFRPPSKENDQILITVRNPIENLIRYNLKSKKENDLTEPTFENLKSLLQDLLEKDFIFQLLEHFETWPEHKRYLIYYEDLIEYPEEEVYRICIFFKIPIDDNVSQFLNEINIHKHKCLAFYDRGHGSHSKGEDNKFHSQKFSKSELKVFEDMIRTYNPYLWDKYLSRYEIN